MAHEDRIHFPAFSRNFELLDVSRGRNIRRVPWQLLLASLIRLVDPARGHQYGVRVRMKNVVHRCLKKHV